jgi:predicted esterase
VIDNSVHPARDEPTRGATRTPDDRAHATRAPLAERRLAVRRTARYVTVGSASASVRELWFACHGYGQLARDFARNFAPLDDGTRLVVCPEALSRFYLGGDVTRHADAAVGATWMTREARDDEVDDYVAYLDTLHDHVCVELRQAGADPNALRLCVLGFSQGVATATRWVARGAVRPDELVLWGGTLPQELGASPDGAARLKAPRLTLVAGERDSFLTPGRIAEQVALLERLGLAPRRLTFSGGHRLDAATLVALAGRDDSTVTA